jgi:hypothetical protein
MCVNAAVVDGEANMEAFLDTAIPLWLGNVILLAIVALLFAWPVMWQIVKQRRKGLIGEMKEEGQSASQQICEVVCETHHVKVAWDPLDGCAVSDRRQP